MYYILIFYVYSILGYFFEMIVQLVMNSKPSSSILYGPWTPIYGFAVLIMLFIKKKLEKFNLNRFIEIILYFIIVTFIITCLEQLGGILLDKVFNITMWNYENLKFHITKYIALEVSFVWGLLAILIAYVIHPFLKRLIVKIPFWGFIILNLCFAIDLCLTLVNKL